MKHLKLLLIVLLSVSCKDANKIETTNATEVAKIEKINSEERPSEQNTKKKGTYLCKINGRDWSYTKASGIVSRHKKTKKREAIFTFTKQLDKGKEVVQLFYDGDSNQLEKVNVHLKVPKNDGKKMTAMYIYHPNTGKFHPSAKISGIIDLSNPTSASGNAEVSDLDVRFDKQNIKNKEDKIVTVTGIKFKGIGYSEAGKQFGSKGTTATN